MSEIPSIPEWAKNRKMFNMEETVKKTCELTGAIELIVDEIRDRFCRESGDACWADNVVLQAYHFLLSRVVLHMIRCTYPEGKDLSEERVSELNEEIQTRIGVLVQEILTENAGTDILIVGRKNPKEENRS